VRAHAPTNLRETCTQNRLVCHHCAIGALSLGLQCSATSPQSPLPLAISPMYVSAVHSSTGVAGCASHPTSVQSTTTTQELMPPGAVAQPASTPIGAGNSEHTVSMHVGTPGFAGSGSGHPTDPSARSIPQIIGADASAGVAGCASHTTTLQSTGSTHTVETPSEVQGPDSRTDASGRA